MALDFFAGCVGGCAGIVVGYPLDTIKVHMQTQDYRNPRYKGNWDCFRAIFAKESVGGLYRGMTSPMAGVAVVNAIIFGVYGQTQRHIPDPDSLTSHFVAGTVAGIAQSPICSPMELVKTRIQLQANSTSRFTGPLQCLAHTYKHEGYRGMFKGLGITLLREAPSFGVYFFTYEAITKTSETEPVSTPWMLLAGGVAGTASWALTYPIDVIKSRIQANGDRYTGMIDCFRRSVRTEGYSCLYKGLSSTILRAFPTNAVTFTVVTWTFRMFGRDQARETSKRKEPETIKTVIKASDANEPFVGKWNTFPTGAALQTAIIPKFRYTAFSIMSTSDTVLGQPVALQLNGGSQTDVMYSAAEQVRGDKCHDVAERLRGNEDEESGERKVDSPDGTEHR
ncbi:PREDICTED: mitochondrial basic amino acids transporter-like [Dufourea novaeangliae]|nr:PREDICTED: mitochondrial basic amino acids transporter-like [Dufourea novaeangliae]